MREDTKNLVLKNLDYENDIPDIFYVNFYANGLRLHSEPIFYKLQEKCVILVTGERGVGKTVYCKNMSLFDTEHIYLELQVINDLETKYKYILKYVCKHIHIGECKNAL